MPDVANALKFQRKITGVEDAYLKQINQYRRETRRALLEIVERAGVSRPAVNLMKFEIDQLSKQVASLSGTTSKNIQVAVNNYLRKQIQNAQRVGLVDTVDIAPVLRRGEAIVKDAETSYMTNQSAWLKQLEQSLQLQSAKLRISNAAPEEITNRLLSESRADGRSSVWAAGGVVEEREEVTNVWSMAGGVLGAYLVLFDETQPSTQYQKMAVATVDERTTDCCLQVHGQVQNLEDPFHLTGTPRFADEVQDPPFFYYCRTSETLYTVEMESIGIPTSEMVDAAKAELTAREDGSREVIYPSSATARRP